MAKRNSGWGNTSCYLQTTGHGCVHGAKLDFAHHSVSPSTCPGGAFPSQRQSFNGFLCKKLQRNLWEPRCHGPGLLKCTGRNFLPHQNHFGTNSSVMLIHFFLFLLITTTRQPDGKSTRMDVHFSELLLGSGGTGIQSSKSCPENEQESSKFASAAALRRKCASAGIFTLCLQACAQRRQASTGQRRGKEEPAR